jgi:hypothetical protein
MDFDLSDNLQLMNTYKMNTSYYTVHCWTCKQEITKPYSGQRFCDECREKARGIHICQACGKEFRGKGSSYTNKYCSSRCRYEGKKRRQVTQHGYVLINVGASTPGARYDGRMLEHRYVFQQYLGIPLQPWEMVHHRDGNKENNDIENLELRIGPHGKGASHAHCPTCTCFERHASY